MIERDEGDTSVGRLLRRAFETYHNEVVTLVQEAGFSDITPAQAEVIALMGEGAMRAVDLAATVGVTKQALSLLTAELSRKDYIESRSDPQDGRARRLQLSEKGHALKAAGQAAKTEAERRLFQNLTEEGRKDFVAALQIIARP